MADHAPAEVEEDDPLAALYRKLNFFPTPPFATRAGAEVLLDLDPEATTVYDPACGQGHMVGPLKETFEFVFSSDVHDYTGNRVLDWLDDGSDFPDEVDWIFTNPPFSIADQFVTRGLQRARRGVALLVRLAFLETTGRYDLFAGETPLTQLAIFSDRVPMHLGRWEPKGGTATAYAFLFWMKGAAPRPPLWIPPGTNRRLTRPDDARRYGHRQPLPLFDGGEGG